MNYQKKEYEKKIRTMDDKQFCEIYSAFYGEKIDRIGQLAQHVSDGEELKELIEFFIAQLKKQDND